MTDSVHIFLYDHARGAGIASEKVRDDSVQGTLFHVAEVGSVLMLAGHSRVRGEVHRIARDSVARMDEQARVAQGVHRRVGVRLGDTPCWTWVVGPALAQGLAPARVPVEGQS